jgi:Phosphotransferase enzyme family
MDISLQKHAILVLYPALAESVFAAVDVGWDSLAIDANDDLIFKFPKHEAAEARLRREVRFLEIIQPSVSIPVPDMTLHEGPPVFSAHRKLKGSYLLADGYAKLSDAQRQDTAEKLALFYAELHAISVSRMADAGALPLPPWLNVADILDKALPLLPPEHHVWARGTLEEWVALPTDPHGTVFGFYDGHGWNMAFDHQRGILNGIYDFADAGFGPLHQDFIYSSFIDEDLTLRIIAAYENITGKSIDRRRVDILTARANVEAWARKSKNGPEGPL